MDSKYFVFLNDFFENEIDGLLKYFPDIKPNKAYEILATTYISDSDNEFGITKIKCVSTGEVFDINELNTNKEIHKHGVSWWCFVSSDFKNEYKAITEDQLCRFE